LAKRVTVDKAKPGQILAEELARHDGVLLAKRGSEVTEGLLRMLRRQNIETLVIEEEERRTKEEIAAEHLANLARLDAVFARVEGEPVPMALKKTLAFMSGQERDKSLAVLELDEETGNGAEGGEGEGGEEGKESPEGGREVGSEGSVPGGAQGPKGPAGPREAPDGDKKKPRGGKKN
jgi:hypothetical protein